VDEQSAQYLLVTAVQPATQGQVVEPRLLHRLLGFATAFSRLPIPVNSPIHEYWIVEFSRGEFSEVDHSGILQISSFAIIPKDGV
jgi:hypothetical protein